MRTNPDRGELHQLRQAQQVQIAAGNVMLEGMLDIPDAAQGLVVFVHGSGSSRHSPRNQQVAQTLQTAGLATLLFDLLTAAEEQVDRVTGRLRFDIDRLAERVIASTDWLGQQSATRHLRIGYFGASTGAAAALMAAAARPQVVGAVVSRGGRPDLAMRVLADVRAPTLLIVGGEDTPVIAMNRSAYNHLSGVKQLEIIPGATHLFEEAGALASVAQLASAWFQSYLVPADEQSA